MIKIKILKKISDKEYIKEQLKAEKINIDLNDDSLLFQETIIIETENVCLGLLNSLRHVGFKEDYKYYLDVDINDIYFTNTDKNIDKNLSFVNTQELKNRINSVIIDNNTEDELVKHLDKTVGNIVKNLNYFHISKREDYISTNDIEFTTSVINIDKKIKLAISPSVIKNSILNVKNITLKKEYAYNDNRYINFSTFTVIPKIDKTEIDDEDSYIFNKEYNKFEITIKTIGSLKSDKLLSRYSNILFIIVTNLNYEEHDDYILIIQGGEYIKTLITEYSHDNKIDIIAKIILNNKNICCYNITTSQLKTVLNIIKKDIISFVSVLNDINVTTAETNINNNLYAKSY